MRGTVYILYSEKRRQYYIGSTLLGSEIRLLQHNEHFYGKAKFTAVVDDWILFFSIECSTLKQAQQIEKHIKKMKSRTYIENLKKYPEITERLLRKY